MVTGFRPYHNEKLDFEIFKLLSFKSPLDYIKDNYRKQFEIVNQNIKLRIILEKCLNLNYNQRISSE